MTTRNKKRTRAFKKLLGLAALVVVLPLLVLLYADELVRAVTTATVPPPVALPKGVEIRVAPRLTRVIGAPSGGASAITLGRTIIVPNLRLVPDRPTARRAWRHPGDTLFLSTAIWSEVIRHERVHVSQRERYGRWYLPVYLYWFALRGYSAHPLELEANGHSGTWND
ncbi:MAG: hypothetical protein ACRENP_03815 [Longimicrobiales bacterium]